MDTTAVTTLDEAFGAAAAVNGSSAPAGSVSQAETSYKYWAFISYNQRDREFVTRLHRKLETYRLPHQLVGSKPRDVTVPARLHPIFLDREEFPGAPSLRSETEQALRESRFLIVVASPNAAKSHYVNEEIRLFKAFGGEQRVLAIIIDGEPNAKRHPKPGQHECFPEALRHVVDEQGAITLSQAEPIAADVRPGKDGFHYALLKLIAGVSGVSFGELTRRDHKRRLVRYAAVAASMATLTIGFAVLSVVAWLSNQRANAEVVAARASQRLDHQLDLALLLGSGAVRAAHSPKARGVLLSGIDRGASSIFRIPDSEQVGRQPASLAFNATLDTIATARRDGTVELWHIGDGMASLRTTLPGGSGTAQLAFSAQGDWLAGAGRDHKVRLWSLQGSQLHMLGEAHTQRVRAVAFNRSGTRLASTGEDGRVVVWDSAGAKALLTLSAEQWHAQHATTPSADGNEAAQQNLSVALSGSGEYVAVGTAAGQVRIWDVAKGRLQCSVEAAPGGKVFAVAFEPDGHLLASGSSDGKVKLWQLIASNDPGVDCLPLTRTLQGHSNSVSALAFSTDGSTLISSSDDDTVMFWDVNTGMAISSALTGHGVDVKTVAFGDAGRAASAGRDGSIIFWHGKQARPADNKLLAYVGGDGRVALSRDGERVLIEANSTLTLAQRATQDIICTMHVGPSSAIALDANGKRAAVASKEGTVLVWAQGDRRVRSKSCSLQAKLELASTQSKKAGATALAFSPDGKALAIGDVDGQLHVWREGSPPQRPARGLPHTDEIKAIAWHPRAAWLVTGGKDEELHTWQVSDEQEFEPQQHPAHAAGVTSLAFTSDGSGLASGGRDDMVLVWAVLGAGKLDLSPRRFAGHKGRIDALAFSPNANIVRAPRNTLLKGTLASASSDNDIMLWDLEYLEPIGKLGMHGTDRIGISFSSETSLVSFSRRKSEETRLEKEDWLQRACQIVRRELSAEEMHRYGVANRCARPRPTTIAVGTTSP